MTVVAALVGALVVGPVLSYAVLRWVGWRVVLPLLFGRVPGRRELGQARPACRRCGESLSPGGLPALPWMAARGRCRRCREPIGRWALAIEVSTGVVFAVVTWQLGWSVDLGPALVLCAGLVAVSAVDLVHSRIPTRFVYLTALGVAVAGIPKLISEPDSVVGAAVGGGLCLVLLGTMHLASPQMLGFGDVRLATLIGAVVGWLAWSPDEPVLSPMGHVVSAMILAGIVGTVAGLVLLAVRRRNVAYPFGPCLAAGAVVVLLL